MTEESSDITLQIEGMDCSNCALGITKSLEKKGMQKVHVDFATGEATFRVPDQKLLKPAIDGIRDLGYKVLESKTAGPPPPLSRIEKRFYITLPFTVLLFFSHMFFPHDFLLNHPYAQLALCIPVYLIGIIQFGKSAWGSIKAGVPNMDVLIFTGSTAAFVYSIAGMILYRDNIHMVHEHMFFETAATIISLVLLGNVMEHRSVRQTTTAIRDLTVLQVEKAKLISLHLGKEIITEVDTRQLHVGALLQVNTGDKVPADGEIISGEASINESMISGESLPVDKSAGDKVIAGTILLNGNFRMRAESVGSQTMLSRIIELVKKAQQEKPEIQKLGDRISAIFVPAVMIIALLTFFLSWTLFDISFRESMMHSIAVLVISCPCAMGLATPTAVMVGIGRAAKKGILIKGGNTLEAFAKIRSIVFDKTGTLTTGDLKIKNIRTYDISEAELKDILYQLEQHSSHPIARSIAAELKGTVPLKRFKEVREEKGLGISAKDEQDNEYMIGSSRMAEAATSDDSHSVYVLRNGKLIATVDLEDELKADAAATIRSLVRQGIKSIILSGDTREKTESLAAKVGIGEVYSRQLPAEKLERIERMNRQAPVAMVGDGVNDAPALARADVGISLGNATQAAISSAQIILVKKNNLSSLAEAQLISKHTLITIKQNLFWAFAYNIIAIPIAAAGLLNPMIGALAMAFSDVIVIGNSIRLKTKKLH